MELGFFILGLGLGVALPYALNELKEMFNNQNPFHNENFKKK